MKIYTPKDYQEDDVVTHFLSDSLHTGLSRSFHKTWGQKLSQYDKFEHVWIQWSLKRPCLRRVPLRAWNHTDAGGGREGAPGS